MGVGLVTDPTKGQSRWTNRMMADVGRKIRDEVTGENKPTEVRDPVKIAINAVCLDDL